MSDVEDNFSDYESESDINTSSSDESSDDNSSEETEIIDTIVTEQEEVKESKILRNLPPHLKRLVESKLLTLNLNMLNTIVIQRCGDISYGAQPTVELDYDLKDLSQVKSHILRVVIKEIREGKCPLGVISKTLKEEIFLENIENKDDLELYLKDIECLISKDSNFMNDYS